ncbi:sporulation integral membrane protein YtvI [Paenibacillus alginolyticus]|uniref:Sporulation integral membrane protein YtvI n=1 Tax=Paenibacillus alginolyticus TaxID=59839 RepID=A0ABT4G6Y4_9BACL|nr:sporulation integral membrane protein YtvI [Paenibacillus alginolyticus]MCY9663579.1 sporulation integral membrane protein YtvI [Paenibacillus alginolyticus]MCY9691937.1 sporulation integral membrane protein YtvI [Paenibacillus alginolyticus]MEC0144127.1 sporulation integral membrane protein YtvI [Paenibacillus alginolyticus]
MSPKSIIIMVLGLLLLYGLFTIGLPFLLALVTAIFLDPLTVLLMRAARVNRLIAATIICTVFTLLTLTLFYFIGLNVVTELIDLGRKAPNYMDEVNKYMDQAVDRTQLFYDSLSPDIAAQVQTWLASSTETLTRALTNALSGISGFFLNIAGKIPNLFILMLMYVIALYLFMFSLPKLRLSFLSMFEEYSKRKMENVLTYLREAIFGFIRAQLIMAVLTYLVTFVGLLVLRAEYPLAISLLVMVMEFVPVIGTGLVFIPWLVYQLLIGHTGMGIGLLVLFLVLTIFRRIVEPKVLSDAVGINALAALISLYVGFELLGITGLFLGPLVVIIYQAMRKAGLLNLNIKLD